jgi:PAS domain S-box-containing protein
MMSSVNGHGHFGMVNAAFQQCLGFSLDRFVDAPFVTFVYPDDVELVSEAFKRARSYGKPESFACRFHCANGTLKWLLWRIYPRSNDFVVAIAKDITPFQQLQDMETARNNFAEALLDTVLAINSSLSFDEVLARILSNIGRVVKHDHVHIMLIEEGETFVADYHTTVEGITVDEMISSLRVPVAEHYYLNRMFDTNRPVVIYDIENDPNWVDVPQFKVEGSFVGSPITVENEVIGFLNAFRSQKNFYTTIHARQLLTFANQVGIAIRNASLYEQAKLAAALEERQRLARELHDSVSQSLYAAHSLASLMPKVLEKKPEKLLEYAEKISQRIVGALEQMRLILIELYPDAITHTELGVLLKQLTAAFTETSGLPVELTSNAKVLLNNDAQIAFYRVAQETLHNIEKHAEASRIRISLHSDSERVTLIVQDDGCGFDVNTIPSAHFGVRNLYERAQKIGAALQIDSEIGRGTEIKLEWKPR